MQVVVTLQQRAQKINENMILMGYIMIDVDDDDDDDDGFISYDTIRYDMICYQQSKEGISTCSPHYSRRVIVEGREEGDMIKKMITLYYYEKYTVVIISSLSAYYL